MTKMGSINNEHNNGGLSKSSLNVYITNGRTVDVKETVLREKQTKNEVSVDDHEVSRT